MNEPIKLTAKQYMDAFSKLPNPEYMRREPPNPGMRYKIMILLEDTRNSANTMVMGKDEFNIDTFSKSIEVEFQIVYCYRIVPYWQPVQPILIVPERVDDVRNYHAATHQS